MSDAPAKPADATAPKKGGPMGAIIVAAIMVVEGAGVFMVARMTSPKSAEAVVTVEGDHGEDANATVEIPLIEERFQNMQTGQVWIWDTEIVLKVKSRNADAVNKVLETKAAEIKEGVAAIFRRAQLNQLKEPGLETLNRQLITFLFQMTGKDAEGHERIDRILIPKCRGFPAN
jgi:flagellar basal body-associated protein FliL